MNIYEARKQAAERLDDCMAENQRMETPDEDDDVLLWLDKRKLRGLPMYARGVGGVQTDSFVPGSDEHCDEMDAP